jgi:hypothetical protein
MSMMTGSFESKARLTPSAAMRLSYRVGAWHEICSGHEFRIPILPYEYQEVGVSIQAPLAPSASNP